MEELMWLAAVNVNTCGAKPGEICRGLQWLCWSVVSSVVKAAGVVCRIGDWEPWSLLLHPECGSSCFSSLFLVSVGLSFTSLGWNQSGTFTWHPKSLGKLVLTLFLLSWWGELFLAEQCPPGTGMMQRRWVYLPALLCSYSHDFPSTLMLKFLKNPRADVVGGYLSDCWSL